VIPHASVRWGAALILILAVSQGMGQDAADAIGPAPFIAPDPEILRAMPHKVFAHYHTQFPRSFDNRPAASDYYATQYLEPGGEGGRHAGYGGFLRDRPLPRDPLPDDWVAADFRWEVEAAAALGIDGFCIDLLEPDGVHLARALLLAQVAARVGGSFRIVPMPDFAAGFALRPERFATVIARFSQEPAAYRMPDGRLLVMAFDAQRMPTAWWRQQIELLAKAGIPVALVPCVQDIDRYRDDLLPFCDGLGDWGLRTPAGVAGEPDRGAPMHDAGKLWMAPVSPQDYRPKDLLAMEAEGATLFKTMWEKAFADRADWVQLVTWNDYSEHTHIAPSLGTGRLWYDLTAWYATVFKTGHEPIVTRDSLHLVLRHPPGAAAGAGAARARFDPPGGREDALQAVLWLTTPGDLVSGGFRRSCPAGLTILDLPTTMASAGAWIERHGTVVERVSLPSTTAGGANGEDLLYRSFGPVPLARPQP
jgi:hypothetical protein